MFRVPIILMATVALVGCSQKPPAQTAPISGSPAASSASVASISAAPSQPIVTPSYNDKEALKYLKEGCPTADHDTGSFDVPEDSRLQTARDLSDNYDTVFKAGDPEAEKYADCAKGAKEVVKFMTPDPNG